MNLRNQYFSQGIVLSGSAPYNRYFSAPKNKSFEDFESSDSQKSVLDYMQETAQHAVGWDGAVDCRDAVRWHAGQSRPGRRR